MAETLRRTWTYEALVAERLDPDLYEIENGELVEARVLSGRGSYVCARVARFLCEHADGARLGVTLVGGRFLLKKEPRRERRPDVAFLSRERALRDHERFDKGEAPPGLYQETPELVVEVLSTSDSTSGMSLRARQFFEKGTLALWLVDPELEIVTVLRPDSPSRPFGVGDELTAEGPGGSDVAPPTAGGILPGFKLELARLFAPL
jgi:Uma2 family endonuclease